MATEAMKRRAGKKAKIWRNAASAQDKAPFCRDGGACCMPEMIWPTVVTQPGRYEFALKTYRLHWVGKEEGEEGKEGRREEGEQSVGVKLQCRCWLLAQTGVNKSCPPRTAEVTVQAIVASVDPPREK